MSGKGSKPRPFSVPKEQFDNNWDRIFKRGKKEQDEKPTTPREQDNDEEYND